jgi:pimeloyl-ACP methyl ester carboxylesterase
MMLKLKWATEHTWQVGLPSNNGAVIVFIHGSAGNRSELLPIAMGLNERGYGALLLDMPGHGESGGRADWGISSRIAVERTIDLALKDNAVRHTAIFGYSAGSCIAVQVAARERRVNALIFLCAFTNLADQIRYQFHSRVPFLHAFSLLATRLAGVHVGAMRTLDLLRASASRPVFIIAGSADGLIPVSMPLALSQAACEPNELWLVEGADHGNVRDTAGPANFDERLSMFLNKALFGGDVD